MSPEQSKWGGEGWQSSNCPQSHYRWSRRDTNPCTASSPRGLAGVYPVRAVAEEEGPCMGKGAEPGSGSRCPPSARPLGGQSMAGGSWGRHLCVPLHRVPMGRRRVPPVPRWRQLLCAGCWRLLSLSGTVLRGLRGLWRLLWVSTMGPVPRDLQTLVGPKPAACPELRPGHGVWVLPALCLCTGGTGRCGRGSPPHSAA